MRKHSVDFSHCKRLTQSHHKASCDVRHLHSQYLKTGMLPAPRPGLAFRDMSVVPDFQTAMGVIAESKSAFERLPAALRAKFDNNPDKFVAYVHDSRNVDDLVALGLATKPVVPSAPEPISVRVVPDSTTTP